MLYAWNNGEKKIWLWDKIFFERLWVVDYFIKAMIYIGMFIVYFIIIGAFTMITSSMPFLSVTFFFSIVILGNIFSDSESYYLVCNEKRRFSFKNVIKLFFFYCQLNDFIVFFLIIAFGIIYSRVDPSIGGIVTTILVIIWACYYKDYRKLMDQLKYVYLKNYQEDSTCSNLTNIELIDKAVENVNEGNFKEATRRIDQVEKIINPTFDSKLNL
jgi:hypothetical protein